jgi:flagellar biosynthesis/type III secretory pathway ATPase
MPLTAQIDTLHRLQSRRVAGTIVAVRGLTVLAEDLPLPVGTLVRIECDGPGRADDEFCRGEVVGFDGRRAIIMLFDRTHGIAPGSAVIGGQSAQTVSVGRSLLGRVINALGEPIDNKGKLKDTIPVPLNPPPVPALTRRRVIEPLPTGVRAIDGLMTLGKGQRVGVFAGPGVGKSTMLASIARNTSADINVLALVGERRRHRR